LWRGVNSHVDNYKRHINQQLYLCIYTYFNITMRLINKTLLILCLSLSIKGFAILTPVIDSIPMKDGRKLAVDIYIPSGMSKGPVILIQTPYNRVLYRLGLPLGIGNAINSSNYIIAVADWRGFYGSRKAGYIGSPDRGTDGYWAVEWLAAQSWSNGRIGTWGPSALGKVQFQTAQTNPPHLTCICPLVAGPQFDYNEYFPNGALRTEYVQQLDQLGFGLTSTLMAHPYDDATWTFSEKANFYPDSIRVPAFMIGGWYDHNIEVMLSFFTALQKQSPVNVRNRHKLLMGPWVHGGHGTANVGTSRQGELDYPNANNKNDSISLKFFDYYLRDITNQWDSEPAITYYQMGENTWQNTGTWPPAGTKDITFYLQGNKLSEASPSKGRDSLSFTYDPSDPSPTIGGPTLRSDLDQGPYDQSVKVEGRNDLLVFTADVLKQQVILKGHVKLFLKVSSDKTDTDIAVRLTDVYPDGRSMLVNDGIMRMRFRDGLTQAEVSMMVPGKIYDCEIELPNTSITFLAGHRIRIDVSSSNYPRFNRNMNNGADMYPGKSIDSLFNPQIAYNTIHTGSAVSSYITMPLVDHTSGIKKETFTAKTLSLYPNPAGDVLWVRSPSDLPAVCALFITNQLGLEVMRVSVSGNDTPVDISSLSQGVYQVSIRTGTEIFCHHFVKL
jgi:predicted acyl esterase